MSEKREIIKSGSTDFATISLRGDGILEIIFNEEYHLEVEDILALQDEIRKIIGNVPTYIMVVPGAMGGISREAREIPMFTGDTRAIAIVTKLIHQRILGNLYFRFKKADFTNYKLIKKLEDAEAWLLEEIAKGN